MSEMHYVISSPSNAGLFAGHIIFTGSQFECENYLQIHDDMHGRTGQPVYTVISADEWNGEFARRSGQN